MITSYHNAAFRRAVPMENVVEAVREAFIANTRGEFEVPQRESFDNGRFLVMQVRHKQSQSIVVKTLTLNPDRTPTICGTVVWEELNRQNHVAAEAATATALRTGAVSGVATALLAHPEAARLTIVGAGQQAADQVRAVLSVRSIRAVTISAPHIRGPHACIKELSDEYPDIVFHATTNYQAAVETADVVCCVTPSTEPLFSLDSLKPSAHVNLIGSYRPDMRELSGRDIASAELIVDDRDAVLAESGEIIEAVEAGLLDPDDLVTLGEALCSGYQRKSYDHPSVFKSVGLAIQDWAVMKALVDRMP